MIPGYRIRVNITSYDSEELADSYHLWFIFTVLAVGLLGLAFLLYIVILLVLFVQVG